VASDEWLESDVKRDCERSRPFTSLAALANLVRALRRRRSASKMNTFLGAQELIFALVLKVGFAASLAALLVRFRSFRNLLFAEIRDSDQKVMLLLFLTPPLAIGVFLRLLGGYRFFDLTLEGSFLMGLIGGRVVGLLGGSLISLPAFGNHEWLSSPIAALAGLIGGVVRETMPEKEDIWHFGPFLFLSVPEWIWKLIRYRKGNWAMLPLFACVGVTVAEIEFADFGRVPEKWLYSYRPTNWGYSLLVVMTSMMCVAMAIKIWNNTRIEMNLEQNQQLLLKARMDALTSQINPHFLFNTLNTVSSLIRFDPDMARGVVLKLSNILRRLLRKHETFVPLREELEFIDDYLDIEVIRFGRDKLQIFKEIDEETLETFVPSMLLQPMVENSIKHGLAPRLEGGQIHLRTRQSNGRLLIEIEDNGMGISPERLAAVYGGGIGISNVHERLRLLYGDQFKMDIRSKGGKGTQIHIEIPELATAEPFAGL
jgi:two-component system LytT family sensor kinase